MNKTIFKALVIIGSLSVFTSQAQELKMLQCDTQALAVSNPDKSNQQIVPLGSPEVKNAMVLDIGTQFQVTMNTGEKFTSPELDFKREGIYSAVGRVGNGREALFVKRNGEYQITMDGVRWLLFANCSAEGKLM